MQEKHGKRQHWKALQAIVRGDKARDIRACTSGSGKPLNPEDQVNSVAEQSHWIMLSIDWTTEFRCNGSPTGV